MLKFIARRKAKKAMQEVLSFGVVHPYNWAEFRDLWITAMQLNFMAECSRHGDPEWAYLQVFDEVVLNREKFLREEMPSDFYADLVVTMKTAIEHLPAKKREAAAALRKIREEIF